MITSPMVRNDLPELVDHLFRHQAGRLVSHLVRSLGPAHIDLAEDVVQEALISALRNWPFRGIPNDPSAWLYRVARNRAIDTLRRQSTLRSKLETIQDIAAPSVIGSHDGDHRFSDELDDDTLRMVFACCHPSIQPDAQVALTLKLACGLEVSEISRAFLTQEVTIAQRIVRAKRQLRSGKIEIEVPGPTELTLRLRSVLEVVYLMFNEGYSAHQGENLVRSELVDEAIRLGTLIVSHTHAARPEAHALLSLMRLQGARLPARVDDNGRLVLLEEQDRSRWDRRAIAVGLRHLELASAGNDLTSYHVQAAIAACHASARSAEDTDWHQILAHYDTMLDRFPSPVVQLNRAVAVAMVRGPERGLEALAQIQPGALASYYLLPAARAELLRRAGRSAEAMLEYRATLEHVTTDPERRFIQDRLSQLG